ncbi:MAG: anthranilate phosphoribosyltransferase [Pyrinomonadaceae bacterium]
MTSNTSSENLYEMATAFGRGENANAASMRDVFLQLIESEDVAAIQALLIAWAKKGYTSVEIAECAQILRNRCIKSKLRNSKLIDIVGSGGSQVKTFNVSTAAAFVVAACGIPVAKHGNRAATSSSGAADVLSELGLVFAKDAVTASNELERFGITFMFAPYFHSLKRELAIARTQIKTPTIFNILGPLANPAGVEFQLTGIWNREILVNVAEAIKLLGTKRTLLVHGKDGLDEISPFAVTFAAEISAEGISQFEIKAPKELQHLSESPKKHTPQESAMKIRRIFNGELYDTYEESAVILNAGYAIAIAESLNPEEGIDFARETIRKGGAQSKLDEYLQGVK